jgi:energy-coupling factor transport system ATP-binding protein
MKSSLSINSLSFTYRGKERPALKDVTGEIREGAFIGIIGNGGAGKSTLCCAMNGLVPRFFRGDYSGSITVYGKDPSECNVAEMAKTVGLVLQDFEAQLFSTNVELDTAFGPENLGLPREEIGRRITRHLAFVGLEGMRNRDSSTLSGGQKQRLAICSVLAMESPVLVMDEPATDLDPKGREHILSISRRMKDDNRTLIIADNDPENLINADRLWLMREGELIACNSPREILIDNALLDACGVMALPTVALFHAMGWQGNPLTVEDAIDLIQKHNLAPRRRRTTPREQKGPVSGTPVLEARGLSYCYPSGKSDSLQDINISINDGEFLAILGQNGSGKTTLAKHFNGLLRPRSGEMLVNGRVAATYSHHELARTVGYVFQNPDHQIFAPTVYEEVSFGLRMQGCDHHTIERQVAHALSVTGLEGYEDRSPFLLTKGDRQRVVVACVLAVKPKVIILDEPTTGLDYKHQHDTMELLKELNHQGHTIIVITHAMWIAEAYCSRTIVMKDGRIISDGDTRSVFFDEAKLSRASLAPSHLVRLSNWLGAESLTVEDMVKELKS